MNLGFWFGLALLVLFVGFAIWALRQFRKVVREDERQKYEQRQAEARQADQERANGIAEKADAAAVAVKKEAERLGDSSAALADRLRGSGRGRKTKDGADQVGADRLR